ncbi:MAG: DNA replication/repair protein RecF [Oscillospiraceae bacterium]|nr:DNA replication/repair protein RecF [Oscillospiraceae bacterium]
MKVDKIALSGFRNYDEEAVELGPGVNVIWGRNAQGKTNLLEAVYLLTGAHSFRTRFDRELIGRGCDWASILAEVDSGGRSQTIRLLFRPGQRRQVMVNGSRRTSGALAGLMTAVLFSPEDLYLIKDGSAARRRLMDTAISQLRPGYGGILSDFNRLYENKTRILKDWREKPSLLDTLDEFSDGLAKCSARMIRYRASFTDRLAKAADPIHRDFSGGGETLTLTYKTVSTVTDPRAPAEEIYRQILAHQQAHRQAELEAGQCLTGAHKDDIDITIDGLSARSFASQGQTRTAALSIKLAEREIFKAETGEYPVLLLDDVLSELDGARQEFVLNRIGGGQTLITCCEDENISRRTGGRVFSVENGRIK